MGREAFPGFEGGVASWLMSVLEGILRLQCRERSEEMKRREQSISGHR